MEKEISHAVRLGARGVTRRFGSVVANDGVDLSVAPGTIHAVVGENGAGKTTLMRILYGMVRPDAGTIELDGVATEIADPGHAIRLGIGMVHQRFELVEDLSALENLVLGDVPRRFGVVFDRERALAAAERLAAELGVRMPWQRLVRDLGVEPAMFESGEPVAYQFHGTVAVGLTPSQLEDARATLGETPQFRFPLQRLGLFLLSPAGWVLRRRVTLRAAL